MTQSSATPHRSGQAADTAAIRPFHVRIPEEQLVDLRRRIAATQSPEKETVCGPVARRAARDDAGPRALLGDRVRLAHVRGQTSTPSRTSSPRSMGSTSISCTCVRTIPRALPLIVTHGWPGSIIEQLKIIGPLTDPTAFGGRGRGRLRRRDSVDAGYGFSDKPTSTGWGPERMGRAWAALMKRLGYTRYVAQGGDWGAFVVDQMGLQAPPGLLAIHTNMPATVPADVDKALLAGEPAPSGLSADEKLAYEQLVRTFKQVEYARMMAARPQTLYGIADSRSGWPPGFSTTTMPTASRPRRSPRR